MHLIFWWKRDNFRQLAESTHLSPSLGFGNFNRQSYFFPTILKIPAKWIIPSLHVMSNPVKTRQNKNTWQVSGHYTSSVCHKLIKITKTYWKQDVGNNMLKLKFSCQGKNVKWASGLKGLCILSWLTGNMCCHITGGKFPRFIKRKLSNWKSWCFYELFLCYYQALKPLLSKHFSSPCTSRGEWNYEAKV